MCSQQHRSERPYGRAARLRGGGGWAGSYTPTLSLTDRDPGQQTPTTASPCSWSGAVGLQDRAEPLRRPRWWGRDPGSPGESQGNRARKGDHALPQGSGEASGKVQQVPGQDLAIRPAGGTWEASAQWTVNERRVSHLVR